MKAEISPLTQNEIAELDLQLVRVRSGENVIKGRALLEIERLKLHRGTTDTIHQFAVKVGGLTGPTATRCLDAGRMVNALVLAIQAEPSSAENDRLLALLQNHKKDGSLRLLVQVKAPNRLRVYRTAARLAGHKEPRSRHMVAAGIECGCPIRLKTGALDPYEKDQALAELVRVAAELADACPADKKSLSNKSRRIYSALRVLFDAAARQRAGMIGHVELAAVGPSLQ